MLRIEWVEGESKGYTDLFADGVLACSPNTVLVHQVIGPRGGRYLAKCAVNIDGQNVDFDYAIFPGFNTRRGMYLGVLRITTRDGWPHGVLWRPPDGAFTGGGARVKYEPGVSLAEIDIKDVRNAAGTETSSQQIIEARLGQGNYRRALEARWGGRCALTGVSVSEMLVASHVKPWSKCNDRERLDPKNGLLLAAHADALFDRYLITFDVNGNLRWHETISEVDRNVLALPPSLRLELTAQEKAYLKEHSDIFDAG